MSCHVFCMLYLPTLLYVVFVSTFVCCICLYLCMWYLFTFLYVVFVCTFVSYICLHFWQTAGTSSFVKSFHRPIPTYMFLSEQRIFTMMITRKMMMTRKKDDDEKNYDEDKNRAGEEDNEEQVIKIISDK